MPSEQLEFHHGETRHRFKPADQAGFEGVQIHKSTILRFRHRLKTHKIAEQILRTVNELLTAHKLQMKVSASVDATLIAAPTSTKNKNKARDPEMRYNKKGSQ